MLFLGRKCRAFLRTGPILRTEPYLFRLSKQRLVLPDGAGSRKAAWQFLITLGLRTATLLDAVNSLSIKRNTSLRVTSKPSQRHAEAGLQIFRN